MGIIPLQFLPGETAESLGLTGKENYTIQLPSSLQPGQLVNIQVSISLLINGGNNICSKFLL